MLQLCNVWQDVCFPHLFDDSKIMKTILDTTKPRYSERLFCLFLCPSLYRGSTTFFLDLKLYIVADSVQGTRNIRRE